MKILTLLLIVIAMIFVLAACDNGTNSNDDSSGLIRVGFSQCDLTESDWRKANTASMQESLSESNGFSLTILDAQNDPDKQLADVRNLIQQGFDYIVIATVQEAGWETVLQQARDAEIPVILVDRLADVSEDLYVTWVGANFKGEGETAVRWLQNFRGSDVNAVHLQGVMGSSAQVGRTSSFLEGAAANGWTINASMTANWDTTQAMEIMQFWLEQFPEINVVYAENDNMAYGAIQAIEDAGLKAGGDDGITIISFDANRRFLQLAYDTGKINYNVECNPLHGPRVAQVIQALERGEILPKITYVDGESFDWRALTQEIIDSRQY